MIGNMMLQHTTISHFFNLLQTVDFSTYFISILLAVVRRRKKEKKHIGSVLELDPITQLL